MFDSLAYTESFQSGFAVASYHRNPNKLEEFKKKKIFLARLNNEVDFDTISEKHKQRITSLNAAMFVQFLREEVVIPKESELFGQMTPDGQVKPME